VWKLGLQRRGEMSIALKIFCCVCGEEHFSPIEIDKDSKLKTVNIFCSKDCEKKFKEMLE